MNKQVKDIGIALPAVTHLVGRLLDEETSEPSDFSDRERAGQVGLRQRKNVKRDAHIENSDIQLRVALHFTGHFDFSLVCARIGVLEDIEESLLGGKLDVMDFLF